MSIRKTDPVWGVVYSHYHGDIGIHSGITHAKAVKQYKKLLADSKYLDWAMIVHESQTYNYVNPER